MKTVSFKLNTVLAGVVGIACLAVVLLRTFVPTAYIPLVDVPNLAAVCAVALVVDCWLDYKKPAAAQNWLAVALLGALTFALLPWAAGLCAWGEALRLGVVGGLLFTLTAFMFGGIRQKLFSGPHPQHVPDVVHVAAGNPHTAFLYLFRLHKKTIHSSTFRFSSVVFWL